MDILNIRHQNFDILLISLHHPIFSICIIRSRSRFSDTGTRCGVLGEERHFVLFDQPEEIFNRLSLLRFEVVDRPCILYDLISLAEPMEQHNSFVTLFWGRKMPFLDRH